MLKFIITNREDAMIHNDLIIFLQFRDACSINPINLHHRFIFNRPNGSPQWGKF